MAEKEKNKGLGIPQLRGSFQLKGKVFGVAKENFYKAIKTKTNKDFRTINFGVQVSPESSLFVSLNGMPQDKVYFSKARDPKVKDSKTETKSVDWSKRESFRETGFRLIGVNMGLKKTHDDKGKEMNDKVTLVPFDACDYLNENLKDGMSVFVRGNLEYSHFTGQDGNVSKSVKLVPTQISLCKEVDFEEQGYEFIHDFTQTLIVEETQKNEDKFSLVGKVVNYNTIENVEFELKDKDLATKFKKGVKPYNSIKVWGKIDTLKNMDKVEEDDEDGWGEKNSMDRVNSSYKKIFVVTGADPKTLDMDTYSQDVIEQAVAKMNSSSKAEKEFGDSEDWGSTEGLKTATPEDDESAW
jgi:hypothetical protein